MTPFQAAVLLAFAERARRRAQALHDGSEEARRRYAFADVLLRYAEAMARDAAGQEWFIPLHS